MPATRRLSPTIGGLLLCAGLLFQPTHVVAQGPPALAGAVKDTLGNLLPGVEVLVVDRAVTVDPLAVTLSDGDGRFSIPTLLPGTYRLAALKQGYMTYVGQVDTKLKNWIDVVLHPMPDPDERATAPLPRDASWALRLPRRTIFRERGARVRGADAVSSTPRPVSGIDDQLDFQIDHMLAVLSVPGGRDHEPTDVHGTETRLRVASSLGERGSIRLLGRRENLDSSWESNESLASATRESESLNVGFSYETSAQARLDVKAFYSERDLELAGAASPAAGTERSAQRAWGYVSEWSTQLNDVSRLALQMDYHDARFRLPNADPGIAAVPAGSPATQGFSHRSVAAAGSYELVPADRHQVQVGFRAQLLNAPLNAPRAAGDTLLASFGGLDGLSLRLNAQDAWAVAGPFTLVYGLGYRQALSPHNSSLIVSRLGGTWSADDLVLRLMVSHHTVSQWNDAAAGAVGPGAFQPSGEVGYDAELQIPLSPALTLRGTARYAPIQFDPIGYDRAALSSFGTPIFVTDGNAAVRESAVALVREQATTRTFVELASGQAVGTLTSVLPFDSPVHVLAPNSLRYNNGRLGVHIVPAGTDLQLEYRRIEEEATDAAAAGSVQDLIELRLTQDLMRFEALGHWRFLMAVRMASQETAGSDEWIPNDEARALHAFNRGVSAGLSVSF